MSDPGLNSLGILPTEIRYKIYQAAAKAEERNVRVKVYVGNESRKLTFWIPEEYRASFSTLLGLQLVSKAIAAEAAPDYVRAAVIQVDIERWECRRGVQPDSYGVRKVVKRANNLYFDIWWGFAIQSPGGIDPDAERSPNYTYPKPPAFPRGHQVDDNDSEYTPIPHIWKEYLSYCRSITPTSVPPDFNYDDLMSGRLPFWGNYLYYCASITRQSPTGSAWRIEAWERNFCENVEPLNFWGWTVQELKKIVEGATTLPVDALIKCVADRQIPTIEPWIYEALYEW